MAPINSYNGTIKNFLRRLNYQLVRCNSWNLFTKPICTNSKNAIDIIFEVNEIGNFKFVNDFTLKSLGFKKRELINKHYLGFIREDFRDSKVFYRNLSEHGQNFPTMNFSSRKDGKRTFGFHKKVQIEMK
jgi:PAS domain S-box-containing protein